MAITPVAPVIPIHVMLFTTPGPNDPVVTLEMVHSPLTIITAAVKSTVIAKRPVKGIRSSKMSSIAMFRSAPGVATLNDPPPLSETREGRNPRALDCSQASNFPFTAAVPMLSE